MTLIRPFFEIAWGTKRSLELSHHVHLEIALKMRLESGPGPRPQWELGQQLPLRPWDWAGSQAHFRCNLKMYNNFVHEIVYKFVYEFVHYFVHELDQFMNSNLSVS